MYIFLPFLQSSTNFTEKMWYICQKNSKRIKSKNKQKMYEYKGEEKMNYLNEVKKVNKYKSTL